MAGTSAYSMSVSELTFPELMKLFGRRKTIITFFVLVCTALGFGVSMMTPPEYEGSFRVLLEGGTQARSGTSASIIDDLSIGNVKYDVMTQMEILNSDKVYFAALEEAGVSLPATAAEKDTAPQIRVDQIDVSQVVLVTVKARSKEDVQKVCAALPKVYDKMIIDEQRDEIKRIRDNLKDSIKNADDQLLAAQTKLADYQASNDIIEINLQTQLEVNEEQRTQQLKDQADAEAVAAEANLDSLVAEVVPKEITEDVEETNSEEVRAARVTLSNLKAERAQLLIKYYEDHPRVKALDARIKSQEDYVENELPKSLKRTITRVNPEYSIHQDKIRNARASLEAARARAARFGVIAEQSVFDPGDLARNKAEIAKLETQLEEIKTTKKSRQAALDNLEIRINEIKSPIVRLGSSTSIVEQTKPRWTLNIVLGALVGLMLGAFAAIARDLSLDRINYPAEAVGIAGADILARIPLRSRSRSPLIEDPQRARAFEAYRVLRAGVLTAMEASGNNAVVITSPEHGDGKTVVAGNLAVACALEGRKTVIVDANLRSPKIDRLFKLQPAQGLTDVIAGEVGLDAVLMDGPVENLQVLPAGNKLATPTEYIASPEMKRLIETLKQKFDVVIFDSPDSLSVADSVEMTRQVENFVFLVELEKTNKSRMDQSLMYQRQAKGKLLGVVVNRDPSVRERYT